MNRTDTQTRYNSDEKDMIKMFWVWLNDTEFKTTTKNRQGRRKIKYSKTQFADDFGISYDTLERILKSE